MANIPADATAFAEFSMQKSSAASFDAGLATAGDELAVVFSWDLGCFKCEIAGKAMLVQPDAIRALCLKKFHSYVYRHREPGRRFVLHGVPVRFLFHRGKQLRRATGWHGLAQFEAAAAAAREKIRGADLGGDFRAPAVRGVTVDSGVAPFGPNPGRGVQAIEKI